LREVERERARERRKGFWEKKSFESKKMVEIQGAKVKPKLGLCSFEVRGIMFIHNLSYNHFFYLNSLVLNWEMLLL